MKIWKGSVSCEGRRELFLSFEAHLVHELEKHLRVTKARVTLNSKVWSFSYNWKGGWKSYLMRRSTYFISDEFFLEFIVPKKSSFFRFSIFCNATTILTKYKSRLFDLYHSCNHFYETLHCRKSISATCDQVFCCVSKNPTFPVFQTFLRS